MLIFIFFLMSNFMTVTFCPLASGSKGNCIFLQTKESTFLIDLGISFRLLQQRLREVGSSIDAIDAILISHEHMDHISGLKVLTEKKKIPVLANAETAKGIYHNLQTLFDFHIFTTNEKFSFRDISVDPFTIQHDTLDPVGFIIQSNAIKIGVCTDIGMVTTFIEKKLAHCHVLYLEANHEIEQVHASSRPTIYKQRVLGRQGHLSNQECGALLQKLYHENLQHVFLAHLSSECNSAKRAMKTIQEILQQHKITVPISIALQDGISHCLKL